MIAGYEMMREEDFRWVMSKKIEEMVREEETRDREKEDERDNAKK